jgi:hypothetical protein
MAFEIWRSVTQGNAAAARDILTILMLQDGSSILSWLAPLGKLASIFEILLGAAGAVFGVISLLCCFGRNALCPGTASIDEQCNSARSERYARVEEPPEQNPEVTIRIEDGRHWLLHRHRCIVTVHAPSGSVQIAGREVWCARNENSRL